MPDRSCHAKTEPIARCWRVTNSRRGCARNARSFAASRNEGVRFGISEAALELALDRAIGLWFGWRDEFRKLAVQGMGCDYSWNWPGQHYLNIYEMIRHK